MAKGVRKNISIPGILEPVVRLRMKEFGYRTLSPLIVDLVCYDLRSGAPHTITLAISKDFQAAQDAVDTELAARYRPNQKRNGLLVDIVEHLSELRSVARKADAPPLPLITRPARIMLPALIWPLADARWKELDYTSLSAYLTGLIRYDLLIGGPHHFSANDAHRKIQSALDLETKAARERKQSRKLFLDYLIERSNGHSLTANELQHQKRKIAQLLLSKVCKQSAVKKVGN